MIKSSESGRYDETTKTWFGPPCENLDELVSKWPSLGHYFVHKLDTEFSDTILFTDFESGRSWTGSQIKAKIMNVACALVDKYQFESGTAVCISYDNSDHLLILACAVIFVGGVVACSYSKDPYAELLYLARKVEPKFLFCHEKNIGWAKQLRDDLDYDVKAIVMDKKTDQAHHYVDYFEDLFWFDHTRCESRHQIPVPCKDLKRQVGVITMSSGTSGKPKAIPQTHWNALADLLTSHRKSGTGFTFACCASLDYVSGRLIMFGAIHSGYQTIILNGFEPRSFLQACERYKVHIIYIGAASFYNLITYKHLGDYDISSVRCVFPMGAKIVYLDELRDFFQKHPHVVVVRQGYGASEFSGLAMNSMTPDEYLRDCENCGRLLPGAQARIVEAGSGKALGPKQRGILHIRSENIFPGYYDREQTRPSLRERRNPLAENSAAGNAANEEAPARESPFVNHSQVFDAEGFYISGDYAYFNDKQELYILGRHSELMSCRGQKKVLPQELETIIDQHPGVEKVCVLGVANKRELTLHCPRAFVVPKANYYTDEEIVLSSRMATLNDELNEAVRLESLVHTGNTEHKLNKMSAQRRHQIVEDLMQFVNERVGWEKQLTAGIVLLDDIPTLRATGKFDKNYLRSLSLDDVEVYGDRSG